MSALATLCLSAGFEVSGSDRAYNPIFDKLQDFGAKVYEGEDRAIIAEADTVVFSSAVQADNSEFKEALRLGKRIFERHEFLGEIADCFDVVVAVGGTHGKTTVTSMIAHILKELDAPFVAHIGGDAEGLGNLYISPHIDTKAVFCDSQRPCVFFDGASDENTYVDLSVEKRRSDKTIFVTEACEYKRNLLSLHPDVAVIINVECDHPDCYENIESVRKVFAQFCRGAKDVVICKEHHDICKDAHMSIIEGGSTCESTVCAKCTGSEKDISNADVYTCEAVQSRVLDERARQRFVVKKRSNGIEPENGISGEILGEVKLPLSGRYNMINAVFAIAAACALGYSFEECSNALESFGGVARRFEKRGVRHGADIVFDYAHHPTEIGCALEVANSFGRVLTVFQPHTYSRTARYIEDFVKVLGGADTLILMPTYAAREKTESGMDSFGLMREIKIHFPEKDVYITDSQEQTADFVESCAEGYDMILFLGAGDIYEMRKYFE